MSNKREAYERLVKRIIDTSRGTINAREARKLAERVATRHDHKHGK